MVQPYIEHILDYSFLIFATPITAYNTYIFYFAPNIQHQEVHIFSIVLGLTLMFSDIDRNVYKKRLDNLKQKIQNEDISVERVTHMNYTITDDNDG